MGALEIYQRAVNALWGGDGAASRSSGAREIVYCHHEPWDGKGYPRGLTEIEIPLGARIFPLCDAFDAMTTSRPNRTAMPVDGALDQLRDGAGTQFWPDAVDAFLTIPGDVLESISDERRSGAGVAPRHEDP